MVIRRQQQQYTNEIQKEDLLLMQICTVNIFMSKACFGIYMLAKSEYIIYYYDIPVHRYFTSAIFQPERRNIKALGHNSFYKLACAPSNEALTGGYLIPCSPEKKSAFSLVPPNQNLEFLCSLFPKIAFVPLFLSILDFRSLVPLK